MLKTLYTRFRQKYRTIPYPKKEPVLPDRFKGLPLIDYARCSSECTACASVCPTGALARKEQKITLDLGKCLFCSTCTNECKEGCIQFSRDYRLAARTRDDLILSGETMRRVTQLEPQMIKIFGRSLKLRQVSAGGCNACEADVNVLGTIVFDLGRFGIQFVASPRHADGLLITGPVTENMKLALQKTYDAVPAPKIVIAAGACAISGGPYIDHPETHNGADSIIPVDLYIPGCPPHPMTILDGLLSLLGKLKKK